MALIKKTRGGVEYQGIRMMTAEGVHEGVERLIREAYTSKKRKSMTALDLASGQGALAQRLKDLSFVSVDAWELDTQHFQPKGIRVKAVDLNRDFPEDKKYDLITACEIIEHLENPYHFLRQISSVLKPGGSLILSTPNVESAVSRIEFLFYGQQHWFHEEGYRDWGHITPVTTWVLDKALRQAKLEIVGQDYNNTDATVVIDGKSQWLLGALGLLLYPLMQGNKRADISIWRIVHNPILGR